MRNRKETVGQGQGWMLSYSLLMNFLMIFFAMLYTYSLIARSGVDAVIDSIRESLPAVSDLRQLVDRARNEAALDEMLLSFQGSGLKGMPELSVGPRQALMSFENIALFNSAESDISSDSIIPLHNIAKIIKNTESRIVISGHTDNRPTGSKSETNLELSYLRALNVAMYLWEVERIPVERISVQGFGDNFPRADNDTEAGRRRNRRIEILLKF